MHLFFFYFVISSDQYANRIFETRDGQGAGRTHFEEGHAKRKDRVYFRTIVACCSHA